MLSALASLDDRLVEVLSRGDIRFVRASWLRAQPDDYRMVQRQEDLEVIQAKGVSPSPLLSSNDAVALVRSGSRAAGALTYGWAASSRSSTDPAGQRVNILRRPSAQSTTVLQTRLDPNACHGV